jgi:hypothetical protein
VAWVEPRKRKVQALPAHSGSHWRKPNTLKIYLTGIEFHIRLTKLTNISDYHQHLAIEDEDLIRQLCVMFQQVHCT